MTSLDRNANMRTRTRRTRLPSTVLPIIRDPLIGRERELAAARQLILRDRVGLLTLTGAGGTGKTRLAIEVATSLRGRFADGVIFVSLASIVDPALVPSAIAQALRVRGTATRPISDNLRDFLRDKALLLVADNFEQVLPAGPVLTELLAVCPRLKVLVTSRETLRLSGEHTLHVPPLELPSGGTRLSAEDLGRVPSVRLFVERARAAWGDFDLTDDDAAVVAQICQRLDGLPLAIELAAARIHLLSPRAMLARLERRLPLLTGGARDLPTRQQTLRDTIVWSYDLLDEAEQRLFRRLAVFVGGCTHEAVEAICCLDPEPGLNVLDSLGSLVAKSLLRQAEQQGEPRFRMLETIRELAAEQLEAAGETSTLWRRHQAWFAGYARRAAEELRGPRQLEWFELLEIDHDNLRAALEWSTAEAGGVESGAEIAESLAWFWVVRGHVREGRARLERLIAHAPARAASRARILSVAGFLAERQRDLVAAIPMLEAALALWRDLGDRRGIASVLWSMAQAWDDVTQATTMVEESAALFRRGGGEIPREELIASYVESPLAHLAFWALREGDYARARADYDEDLSLHRAFGDTHGVANALRGLGTLAFVHGDFEQGTALFEEGLRLFRDLNDIPCVRNNVAMLACVASAQGRAERGARLFGVSEALTEVSGIGVPASIRMHHDRWVSEVRASLGEKRFAAAWDDGRAMTMEQAIVFALRDMEPTTVNAAAGRGRIARIPENPISQREREISVLIGRGYTNRRIADDLVITEKTVEVHARNIREKLGLTTRAQIVAWAVQQELSPPRP